MKLTDKNDQSVDNALSEQDQAFIDRVAQRIFDSGFVTAAVFALEMVKPLALLGSHAMIFFGPIVSAFIKADGYYRAAEVFEEPQNVERLITRLEHLAEDKEQNNETEKHSER